MGASGIGAVHDRMRSGEIYAAAVVDAPAQGFAAGSRGFGAEALRLGVGREDRALRERDAWRIRASRRTATGPAQGLSTPNVRKFIRLPGLGGRGCDAGMDTTARSRTRESRAS